MLIALAFIAFAAMVASWMFGADKSEANATSTTMVPAAAAAD